jgi:hypothetical protein
MTFMVPFDGTALARAALGRASKYSDALLEDVLAVSIVPEDDLYAREKGWIDGDEDFEPAAIAGELQTAVADIAPEAAFDWRPTDDAAAETITAEIAGVTSDVKPDVVFLGSDNAGRIVTPLSSVGGGVAANDAYDVHIVRHQSPVGQQ